MLYMNYPPCGDCAFSASFEKECTDVSNVAGEGVELTVCCCRANKGSGTGMRSRGAQFIYDRNYNRKVEFDEN